MVIPVQDRAKADTEILAAELEKACRHGDIESISPLIAKGADPNAKFKRGMFLLHWAARSGHADVCRALIEGGADLEACKALAAHPAIGTIDGLWTALFYATNKGHVDTCRALLEHGAKVDILDSKALSPLSRAVSTGQLDVAQVLINFGADCNGPNMPGTTLLHYALLSCQEEMFFLLLSSGADPFITDEYGTTAEQLALRLGRPREEQAIRVQRVKASALNAIAEMATNRMNP